MMAKIPPNSLVTHREFSTDSTQFPEGKGKTKRWLCESRALNYFTGTGGQECYALLQSAKYVFKEVEAPQKKKKKLPFLVNQAPFGQQLF